jgi:hypothetical protein
MKGRIIKPVEEEMLANDYSVRTSGDFDRCDEHCIGGEASSPLCRQGNFDSSRVTIITQVPGPVECRSRGNDPATGIE